MATVTLRTRGDAAPDTAWERYADPSLWSTWSPQIQRVELDAPRLVGGARGTVRAGLLPHPTLPVPFTVLEVDEPARTWAWEVRLGPVRLRLEHGVVPEPGGCATWLTVRGPAPVVAAYAPVARWALGRLVRA
ncbi:SRPBCC family protein [Nocardioides marmoraquaticus]